MRLLWLTKLLPYPAVGGDLIYTKQLIEGCALHGVEVHVVCHRNGSGPYSTAKGLHFHIIDDSPRTHLTALFSLLPNIAARFGTASRKEVTLSAIRTGQWDIIVFDGPAPLALLDQIHKITTDNAARPYLVYVSHNHEETTRYAVARESRAFWAKAAQFLDAVKTGRLEKRAVEVCDLITTNTHDDAELYSRERKDLNYLVVTPAYSGPRRSPRSMQNVPRNVLVLGSFQWVAKRLNIEAFLAAAAPVFPPAGVRMTVAGYMSEDYRRRLSSQYPWAHILGTVERTEDVLTNARIGVVPEQAGGGFKHKLLDYVFSRLPIASLDVAVAGMPLIPGKDYLSAKTLSDLAELIVLKIDDFSTLETIANNAYAACDADFDWDTRCRDLIAAFDTLKSRARPVS